MHTFLAARVPSLSRHLLLASCADSLTTARWAPPNGGAKGAGDASPYQPRMLEAGDGQRRCNGSDGSTCQRGGKEPEPPRRKLMSIFEFPGLEEPVGGNGEGDGDCPRLRFAGSDLSAASSGGVEVSADACHHLGAVTRRVATIAESLLFCPVFSTHEHQLEGCAESIATKVSTPKSSSERRYPRFCVRVRI